MSLFFISPTPIGANRATSTSPMSCTSRRPAHCPTQATASTPPRRYGVPLAQTARLGMAVFQLGAFITPAAIQPFYTPELFATFDEPTLSLIRSIGLTNLLSIAHISRTTTDRFREAATFNAVTLLGTAALYIAIPIKPISIAIPFISSLVFAGGTNVFDLLRTPSVSDTTSIPPQASTCISRHGITKILTAVAATVSGGYAVAAFAGGAAVPTVYLGQLALNAAMWAWGDGRLSSRKTQFRRTAVVKAVLLAGIAACVGQYDTQVAGGIAAAAASCVGQALTHREEVLMEDE